MLIEMLKVILLGIVEGITEWLPISSTGHMILVDEFIKLNVPKDFMEMFLVVIQLGAILAVCVIYFHKLNPFSPKKSAKEKRETVDIWGKVIVGCLPAAVIGLAFNDKIDALDAGADDYLTKPFSVEELLARLRVALRRVRYDTSRAGDQASIYENGELRIDYAAGCVYRGGTEIHLTPIEYKLICVLAKNTGKVLTHNYLLNEVWGSPAASDTPSLRVFMATLRKKIEEDPSHPRYIQTHIGVGYRMIRQ